MRLLSKLLSYVSPILWADYLTNTRTRWHSLNGRNKKVAAIAGTVAVGAMTAAMAPSKDRFSWRLEDFFDDIDY